MRAIYKTKHDLLMEQIEPLRERFEIRGEYAGIHILLTSQKGESEEELIQKAAEAGVKVYGLSSYFIHPEHDHRASHGSAGVRELKRSTDYGRSAAPHGMLESITY